MTKQQTPESDIPEGLSTLVDEVMRGEREVWLPPGTLVSACLIPCLCGAVVPLIFLLFENVFLIQKDDFGVAATFYPMGAGLALIFVAAIMFALLLRGHIQYGRRLLYYVRGLFGVAVILTLAILAGWLDASPISAGISVF